MTEHMSRASVACTGLEPSPETKATFKWKEATAAQSLYGKSAREVTEFIDSLARMMSAIVGDHRYPDVDTLATQIIYRVNPVSPAMDALRRILPIAKHLAWCRVMRVLAPGGNVMPVPASKPGVAKFCVWLSGDLRCGPSFY